MTTKLQQKLKILGLKQIDLSRRSGIKYKTVNRQCHSGIRTTRIAKRYAAVLQCKPEELLEF